MLVIKQLIIPIDFHIFLFLLWKSMETKNCLEYLKNIYSYHSVSRDKG